jgi:hypothetical protein
LRLLQRQTRFERRQNDGKELLKTVNHKIAGGENPKEPQVLGAEPRGSLTATVLVIALNLFILPVSSNTPPSSFVAHRQKSNSPILFMALT